MAKRKTAVERAAEAAAAAVLSADVVDEVSVEDLEDAEELHEDVFSALRKFGTTNKATWTVYSDNPNNEGYIEKLRSDQLDEARFRNVYGPGVYRIVARDAGGNYVKGGSKSIKISSIGVEAKPQPGAGGDMTQWLAMQQQRETAAAARRQELILAILPAAIPKLIEVLAPRPAMDPIALIAAMKGGDSMGEMVKTMAALQQMNGGGASAIEKVIDVAMKLKDIAPVPGEGGTGWLEQVLSTIRDVAPHAKDVLAKLAEQRRSPTSSQPLPRQPIVPPPAPLPPTNGSVPVLSPVSHSEPSSINTAVQPAAPSFDSAQTFIANAEADVFIKMLDPWLRKQAVNLADWAANGTNTELVAEMLLESVPKVLRNAVTPAQLTEWIERRDWWAIVITYHPPLAAYQEYCAELHEVLTEMIKQDISAPPGEAESDPAADSVQ